MKIWQRENGKFVDFLQSITGQQW